MAAMMFRPVPTGEIPRYRRYKNLYIRVIILEKYPTNIYTNIY